MSNKKRYSTVVGTTLNLGESKGGYPQFEIGLRIVEGERAGEDITFFDVVSNHPDAKKWAAEKLRALGMTNTDIKNPEGFGTVKATLCEVFETFEGKSRWKPRSIYQIETKTLADDVVDKFSAEMASVFAETPPVEVSATNKAPTTLPEQVHPKNTPQEDPEDIFAP